MTYTMEQTEKYIKDCIERMNEAIEFGKEMRHGVKDKNIELTLNAIDRCFSNGVGAISLVGFCLNMIDGKETTELKTMLDRAYADARERAKKEVK